MAITHIHAITKTLKKSMSYCMSNKEELITKDDISDTIAYAKNNKIGETIFYTLNTSQNCIPNREVESFQKNIEHGRGKLRKEKPRTKNGEEVLAWHLWQSFDTVIDPIIANEIGRKLAEEVFENFPVTISTHTNTEHTHNHLIICAWDLDGRKWNDCHETKRLIRSVSDKLCREYGLNVLENTSNMKLIKYKDKEGVVRYFEPTDRKIENIKKREAGELNAGNLNSYKNTEAYTIMTKNKKISNREIVRRDIDSLLPTVRSYEHLLDTLKNLGYTIKDKKKNGDWLVHVSFIPPMAEKGVRDHKISNDGFYTREQLTAYIDRMVQEHTLQSNIVQDELKQIPYFKVYEYGNTDIDSINENYRSKMTKDGTFKIVERGELEKIIIYDIKNKNKELCNLYDTSTIKKIIEEQKIIEKKKNYNVKAKEEILVQRIKESFSTLRFIEAKNIYSHEQVNNIINTLWEKYNQCLEGINKLDSTVKQLKVILEIPKKSEELQLKINEKKHDKNYMEIEYDIDRNLLRTYQETILKYKLNEPMAEQTLMNKVKDAEEKLERLNSMILNYAVDLKNYSQCLKVLERIDNERKKEAIIQQREDIKIKNGQETQKKKQKDRGDR